LVVDATNDEQPPSPKLNTMTADNTDWDNTDLRNSMAAFILV
jgi:hypothetical protein